MELGNLIESLQIFVVFLQRYSSNDDGVYIGIHFIEIMLLDDVVNSHLEKGYAKWNSAKLIVYH